MNRSQEIISLVNQFLSHLGIESGVEVTVQLDESSQIYQVLLETDNPSLLIGFHGETLSSLQLILSQHLHSQTGDWCNLSLNVNDYRERREASLHALADTAVSRVLATGQAHALPPMTPAERRLIHLYLSEHPQVATESSGEGRSRCVVVSLKSASAA